MRAAPTPLARRSCRLIGSLLALALLSSRAGAVPHVHGAPAGHAGHTAHDMHAMSDADMQREVDAWFAAHPAHGGAMLGAPADTFLVRNFLFDTNGILGSAVDTARVTVGEGVMFKWVAGSHTTTSGAPGDPDAGSLWDAPISNLNASTREFTVQFNTAGTYPFFCRPHGEFSNMVGVVLVTESTVDAPAPRPASAGFVGGLAPNPTRGGAAFQFALTRAGRARVEVFDASGRRLGLVLDRALDAGLHAGAWDGRVHGARAGAGVYYLRLRMPEGTQTRRLVVER